MKMPSIKDAEHHPEGDFGAAEVGKDFGQQTSRCDGDDETDPERRRRTHRRPVHCAEIQVVHGRNPFTAVIQKPFATTDPFRASLPATDLGLKIDPIICLTSGHSSRTALPNCRYESAQAQA